MANRKKHLACPHVTTTQDVAWHDVLERTRANKCMDCSATSPCHWLCLESGCSYVGCGEEVKDHIGVHASRYQHNIIINLSSERFWCFSCDTEIFCTEGTTFSPDRRQPFIGGSDVDLSETVGMYEPRAGACTLSTADDGDLPGLVGLKNLGNTCYMNAALQSLSNCEPLTRFMLDCCEGVIGAAQKSALTRSYLRLMKEMWSRARPGEAVPSSLYHVIKTVNPAFRGYQQQDAQEFLRCFMDQMDEEMKRLVVVTTEAFKYGSAEDSMSSSSGHKDDDDICHSTGGIGGSSAAEEAHCPNGDNAKEKPLKTYRSIIGDIFDGKILSSVRCYKCDQVSNVREAFQDLSLPIPTYEQLQMLRGGAGNGQAQAVQSTAANAAGRMRFLYPSYWMSWTTSLLKWVWGEGVALNDCLSAFFSEDELKGDNMYSCGHCKKLRNSVKSVRVLQLPEVLCIHLKRFRHDSMLSTKISSHVSFPLTGLDMTPFLHKDCTSCVTWYDLIAVICHHGSVGGGHYTAFCKNPLSGCWYEFDDQYVTEVSQQTVENCQAYVLFYGKKSRLIEKLRAEFAVELRNGEPSLLKFFISKQWIVKFQAFAEPGPITNSDFLCVHGGVAPKNVAFVRDLVVALPHALWSFLHKQYGGGPTVNRLHRCKACDDAAMAVASRQKSELDTFVQKNKCLEPSESVSKDNSSSGAVAIYAISMSWFKQWEEFVRGKSEDAPGPINNLSISILKGGQPRLRQNSSFCQLSSDAWQYLHSIYDGGPVLCVNQYSTPPQQPTKSVEATLESRSEDSPCTSASASLTSAAASNVSEDSSVTRESDQESLLSRLNADASINLDLHASEHRSSGDHDKAEKSRSRLDQSLPDAKASCIPVTFDDSKASQSRTVLQGSGVSSNHAAQQHMGCSQARYLDVIAASLSEGDVAGHVPPLATGALPAAVASHQPAEQPYIPASVHHSASGDGLCIVTDPSHHSKQD